jgi:hypothetical protein
MHKILLVDEGLAVTSALARLLHYTSLAALGREWDPQLETLVSPIEALARMHVRGFEMGDART